MMELKGGNNCVAFGICIKTFFLHSSAKKKETFFIHPKSMLFQTVSFGYPNKRQRNGS